jgi:DNA-binding CsgD family transcriptional regulator
VRPAEAPAEGYRVDTSTASPAPPRPALFSVDTSRQPVPESTGLARWRFDLTEIGSFQDGVDVELIGRDSERATIRALLDGRAPAVLLLDGEAGIGKTSLWRSALAEEDPDGLLIARPTAAEAELSFAALGDLLADVLEEALPSLPAPQRRGLEAALLLGDPAGRPPDQRTIGTALLGVLRELSARRPLLVAIDDVQWLDPASRSALVFCARRLRDEPVRLLLTARTSVDHEQPAELALAAGDDRLTRLSLGPLSLGAVRSLLQKRLDAGFQRPVLRQLYETSGGNPFLALELARELARGKVDVGPGKPLPVPSSLRQLLERRVERLSPAARRIVLTISAAGKTEEAALATVAGAHVREGVDEAVAADVLVREGVELLFSHPLLRSTVYERASPLERQLVHRRLADSAVDVEERARHLALALQPPDATVAAALDQAAERAFARGAIESAAALGEQALLFTGGTETEELQRRRIATAGYLARAGSKRRAQELLDAASAAAPPGPQRAQIALGLVWWGLVDESTRIEMLERAVEDARGDAVLFAQVHALLACLLLDQAFDVVSAERHATLALELAERAGDAGTLTVALTAAENIDFHAGRGIDAARIDRAIALEAVGANPWGDIGVARCVRGMELLIAGELDAARTALEALVADGRSRADAGLADFLVHLADVEILAGDWARARELADEAIDLARELDGRAEEAKCTETLTRLATLEGDSAAARRLAVEGLRLADEVGDLVARARISASLGLLELSAGDVAAARSHLDETAGAVARIRPGEPGMVPFVPDLVEALVAVDELEAAAEATAGLEEQGRRLGRGFAVAGAARCRALIAAARGRTADAVHLLQTSLDEAARAGQPFELARTLLALGVVRRRARQKRQARETLTDAQRMFEELGARLWAERAHAELSRIGGRSASTGELTPSEQRIAQLVAEGKTNKEVAAVLVVAERTVESALTQIYRKLDVRSRTELARRLTNAP